MLELTRSRLAGKYIFFEMLPSFLLGAIIFVLVLLMFQALRLTEFILIHGVKFQTVFEIMGYLSVSFLPVILPMSLLFSVLITYGRLSSDSEIVAFKAAGLNMKHIALPAMVLAGLTTFLSAQTSFYIAPWGNRQFEVLINELGRKKASATIKEGVFSEGFFDLVVYANEVDSSKGELKKVFIYDERNADSPLTIIARHGKIIKEEHKKGRKALLRLTDGNIHRTSNGSYMKIHFSTYDINLFDPAQFGETAKSTLSLTIGELGAKLQKELSPKKRRKLEIEFHRRWALAIACIVFGLLGVALGTKTNKRAARSSGIVYSIVVIVCYWIFYIVAEGAAKSGMVPVAVAIWSVNALFLGSTIFVLRRNNSN